MISTLETANWVINAANLLLATLKLFNLHQHNNIPNSSNNILDLILTNRFDVEIKEELNPILKKDKFHPPLSFSFPITSHARSENLRTFRDLKAADYNSTGFSGFLLDWLTSYLTDVRSYCVKASSGSLFIYTASSGVLQGSYLGPMLFNIFTSL